MDPNYRQKTPHERESSMGRNPRRLLALRLALVPSRALRVGCFLVSGRVVARPAGEADRDRREAKTWSIMQTEHMRCAAQIPLPVPEG